MTPDDRLVVVGCASGRVSVRRLRDGREVHRLEGHSGFVRAVELTPDGSHAVTAGDRSLRLWSLEDGREVCAFDDERALECLAVTGAVVGAAGVTIVGGDAEGRVRTFVVRGLDPTPARA